MIFPEWLSKGDTIGVTACSAGSDCETDFIRLDNAARQMKSQGFLVKETKDVRQNAKGRSASAKERAKELMELLKDPSVKAVIQANGGDFLGEMLSCIDFEEVKKYPKWHQGYSDPTGLLFTLTTNCDLATVYASNYKDFGMEKWHPSLSENLEVLMGQRREQKSFPLYQAGFVERKTGLENYREDTPVFWESRENVTLFGRLLGGCMDCLLDLVGTRFDRTVKWCEKYKSDGILWYLESFALSGERLTMGLWHMKEAGWFEHASGFVFGRPCFYSSDYEIEYREAVESVLGAMGVPIVFEADIGHKAPRLTVVNGAKAEITVKDGRGHIRYQMKE